MTITGNYTQTSAGVLEIDLGGLAPGTFDRLVVNGDATLAGAISVRLHGGFAPVPGSTFGVVSYASKTGSFDTLSSTIPAPVTMTRQEGATTVTLSATVSGNVARNGFVDQWAE